MKSKSYFIILLIFLLVSLVCVIYLSTFTRFHADDYCIAADFNHLNFWSFFEQWFTNWTGRFSYIMMAGILSLGGPILASWLPTIAILVWVTVLSWAILPITKQLIKTSPIIVSIDAAAFILIILFSVSPNLFQSLFWKDGLINYCFPLIGFTFVSGLIVRIWILRTKKIILPILIFVFSFFNGGFSEVFSAMQVASYLIFLGILLIFLVPKKHKNLTTAAIAGLLGAVFAFLTILSAPGNQIRQGLLPEHPEIFRLVTFSIRNAVYIIAKFIIQTPGWALLTILVSFVSGWFLASKPGTYVSAPGFSGLWKQGWFRGLVILPGIILIVVISACAPVVYMLDAYPDDRTIILPLFFIVTGTMVHIWIDWFWLKKAGLIPDLKKTEKLKKVVIFMVLVSVVIGTALTVIDTGKNASGYQEYASKWDKRDQELQFDSLSGKQEVTAYGLESRFGLADLRIEPDYWVNKCMADYYNIPILIGK